MTMEDFIALVRSAERISGFVELFGFSMVDDSDWTWADVAQAVADKMEEALRER